MSILLNVKKLSVTKRCFSTLNYLNKIAIIIVFQLLLTAQFIKYIYLTHATKKAIPEFLDSEHKCRTLDAGRWTLDSGLWTLDTVVDWFRTESKLSF